MLLIEHSINVKIEEPCYHLHVMVASLPALDTVFFTRFVWPEQN